MKKGIWMHKGLVILLMTLLLYFASFTTVLGMPAEGDGRGTVLLGLYQHGEAEFWVREREGTLEILYPVKTDKADENPQFVTLPLQEQGEDMYTIVGNSPIGEGGTALRFERNGTGKGVACYVGNKRYLRHFYESEDGASFRILPQLSEAELRKNAASARPPVEIGSFQPAELVEIVKLDPSIHLDIRYATSNNFMGMPLYKEPRAFLQRPAAEAVVRVHQRLERYGYGLIVYDAYRPWYVTKMFWDATPEKQKVFVADPARGSRHNRGGAVDIGLYDRKTGHVVSMPSGYDEFSPRAYSDFPGGSSAEREHRELLRAMMEKEGFTVYPEEWWHFDYKDWKQYPILNLEFDVIATGS